MQHLDGDLILSPTDLTGFAACAHLTQLELAVVRGETERPPRNDPLLDVLSRRGDEHESAHLARMEADPSLRVVAISDERRTRADLEARARETIEAMRAGADLIYQGAFFDGRWQGFADFLERVEAPSDLGAWSYEVSDTKLARSAKASAVLQLSAYSAWVGAIQGREPEHLYVITGDRVRHRLRVADYAAYHRAMRRDFEAVVGAGTERTGEVTYPERVEHCSICRWHDVCVERRRADDHLSLVAGVSRPQIRRLADVGITTRVHLASPAAVRPEGMAPETFTRIHAQAALQVRGEGCEPPRFEVLPVVRAAPATVVGVTADGEEVELPPDLAPDTRPKGLAALPAPSPGDLFLDLEGDPYVEGGLEYLFGVIEPVDGAERFHAFWGHDPAGEQAAFEATIDLIVDRRRRHPGMHVYHYAAYETTAIRKLMGTYGTREQEVDDLLRGEVFVDLYQVVRHAIRLSSESYGLKAVEHLYLDRRDGAITDAGSSIVEYERWLEERDQQILDAIESYNRDDCVSTYRLREWLEARRAEVELAEGAIARPTLDRRDQGTLLEELDAVDALAEELSSSVPFATEARDEQQHAQWLLAQLLHWHRREEKPGWWRFFERCRPDRTVDDFVDDRECIGGLTYEGVVDTVRSSLVHRYRFAPQEHKFAAGSRVRDPVTQGRPGAVVAIGDDFIDLQRGAASAVAHPTSLMPDSPIANPLQKAAILEVAWWVHEHGIDAPGPHRAARDLLLRRPPRTSGPRSVSLVGAGEEPLDAARRLVAALDGGVLAIQGPPGAGKTYTGAGMILALLAAGKRVGVTAQSHAVITNFLEAVTKAADASGVVVAAIQKGDEGKVCEHPSVECTGSNERVVDALTAGEVQLVAGTSFLFCRDDLRDAFDVIFVDEAGQRSLADVVAVSVAARNVVLLGDPQQLAQVSQGSHPPGAERSALAHLLGEHATMPPDLGLFLDTTHRMHPDLCRFVSAVSYDDKLGPKIGLEHQVVAGDDVLAGAGIRFVAVAHHGRTTAAPEEAAAVRTLVDTLVGRAWTDEHGASRLLRLDDVLVVAPYNAQVAELHGALPDGARVGTVDKFQGQEAPVAIYSMTSSSADDAPRGIDFLYDLHRLNVAMSRARSLSIVVCSPELERVLCRSAEQMRAANALCRLVEEATAVT